MSPIGKSGLAWSGVAGRSAYKPRLAIRSQSTGACGGETLGVFIASAGQARPDYETKAGEPSGPTGAGHSVVVGPTGLRLAEAGYGPETLVVDIDPEDTAEAQRQLPLAAMRKRSVMR